MAALRWMTFVTGRDPDLGRELFRRGEMVLFAAHVAVVFHRSFEELVAAVGGPLVDAIFEGAPLGLGHGLEIAGDGEVLLEDFERIHAADGGRDGEAHGVTQAFFDSHGSMRDHFARAAETFHAEDGDAAAIGLRQDALLEAAVAGVEGVEGHLHRVEGKIVAEHFEMDGRIFVAGEANPADLPLLLCGGERFNGAVGAEDKVRIVVVDDFMNLPDVEMVGA